MEYPDIDPTGLKWEVRSYFDVWEELASSDSTTVVAIVSPLLNRTRQ